MDFATIVRCHNPMKSRRVTMTVRIESISFQHYKALEKFKLDLDRVNLLTGANNAGKSTVVGALRALAIALRTARSKSPERLVIGGIRQLGYRISQRALPISLENVATNYAEGDSCVTFVLSDGNRLILQFDQEEGCVLLPDSPGAAVTTPSAFRARFPLDLTVVPVLGAVEHRELLLEEDTVNAALATPRASRHFRNYWYRRRKEFEPFADLVASTWPGMVLKAPEFNPMSKELTMFVSEDRIDRELNWVGFGFQIWCQLLTHLVRAAPESLVVVDEPEIYLHPDIQRKLLHVLKGLNVNILLATHSAEILSEADPGDVVIIDKRRRHAERLKDIKGVQRAVAILGSQQNLVLASLVRNRRVLFTQNQRDFLLLRHLARRLGLGELATGSGIACISSGGLENWQRVRDMSTGAGVAAGGELAMAAVWDREGRHPEEVRTILSVLGDLLQVSHVHERWDLEAYLLVPAAWDRAMQQALRAMGKNPAPLPAMADLLMEVTDDMRAMIEEQCAAHTTRWILARLGDGQNDDFAHEAGHDAGFDSKWKSLQGRLALLPGSQAVRRLRDRIEQLTGIALTESQIVDAIQPEEVPPDLRSLLSSLDRFRLSQA